MPSFRLDGQTDAVGRKSFLLHPIAIFTAIWGVVFLLYALHLSRILLYSSTQVLRVLLAIWIPLVIACVAYSLIRLLILVVAPSVTPIVVEQYDRLDRRLSFLFRAWVAVTLIEIAYSGGVPLLWVFTGSSKTYFDFGIPSIHGFANSLEMSLALCRFILFLKTGQRRHLWLPVFFAVWPFILISRILFVVSLIQYVVIYIGLKGIKWSTVVRVTAGALAFILIFGIVGDLRSGADSFRQLAQPTSNYPDWLPSGVLWVYIYITTPINNLVHTSLSVRPLNSLLFPNTAISLFPRFIRTFVYGYDPTEALSGDLVTEAFNVSTAYVGPVQDFGVYGVILFSVFIGLLCAKFYHQTSLRGIAIYSVLAQCLATSLFFNHFFSLPIISQVFWLYVIFAPDIRLL